LALHREALEAGMPLSAYLEQIDPSEKGSGTNAFQRQLQEAGIITRSNPEAGWWASEASCFTDTTVGRALYPEFFAREWRKVTFATSKERAILLSSDGILGSFDRPYLDAGGPRWNNQFAPAIPISELVAVTTPISGEDYRSLYMTYDATQLRLFRIGESAEIPMAELVSSERSIRLRKYGRGLRATYEQMRRMRVDKLAWWIRWMAVQSEVDKLAAALNVLVNGDGNAGTGATEYNLVGQLDPATTVQNLTVLAWTKFRMLWEPPYVMTTVLAQIDEMLKVLMLNLGTANIPLAGYDISGIGNNLTPINATADNVRYGWTNDAPNNYLVGFDARAALEQVTEIGSEISETERYITNQTQVITFTENNAFAILDPAATKTLDLAQ
jgi:uncharacterized protein with HEPN domain